MPFIDQTAGICLLTEYHNFNAAAKKASGGLI